MIEGGANEGVLGQNVHVRHVVKYMEFCPQSLLFCVTLKITILKEFYPQNSLTVVV